MGESPVKAGSVRGRVVALAAIVSMTVLFAGVASPAFADEAGDGPAAATPGPTTSPDPGATADPEATPDPTATRTVVLVPASR